MRIMSMSVTLKVLVCLISSCQALNHNNEWNKRSLESQYSSPLPVDLSNLETLSPEQLRALLKQVADNRNFNQGYCENSFGDAEAKIIKTQDSIRNGATFLGVVDVNEPLRCRDRCCSYNRFSDTSETCDLALFQMNSRTQQPACFLFRCYNASSDTYSCLFSEHKGYMAFSRTIAREEEHDVEELNQAAVGKLPNDAIKQKTDIQMANVGLSIPTDAQSKNVSIKTTKDSSSSTANFTCATSTKCFRFQWQCDNRCCVQIHDVCNGFQQCADGSDEIGCPTSTQDLLEMNLDNLNVEPENIGHEHTDAEESAPPEENNEIHSKEFAETDHQITLNNSSLENLVKEAFPNQDVIIIEDKETIDEDPSAVLPLAIGLAVTASILLMVACRVKVMKKKLKRRGRPVSMDESDYLMNGMYL